MFENITQNMIWEALKWALWCWFAYGLIMGNIAIKCRQMNIPITQWHITIALCLSSFGYYSAVGAIVMSLLISGLMIPVCWSMNPGYYDVKK